MVGGLVQAGGRTIHKKINYALVKISCGLAHATCSDTRVTFSVSCNIYGYDNLRVVYGEFGLKDFRFLTFGLQYEISCLFRTPLYNYNARKYTEMS